MREAAEQSTTKPLPSLTTHLAEEGGGKKEGRKEGRRPTLTSWIGGKLLRPLPPRPAEERTAETAVAGAEEEGRGR